MTFLSIDTGYTKRLWRTMHITREDVLKLAAMARVEVAEDEIATMAKQLQDVLAYAERVCQIAADVSPEQEQAHNVLRDDMPEPFPSDLIVAQAPQHEDGLFVVPHILHKAGDEA